MRTALTILAGLAVIALIEYTRRSIIMAIGTETAAAVAEVKAAIVAETEQAATKIIDVVGADAETAAEIRSLLAPIAAIVPDAADDSDGEAPASTDESTGDGTADPEADGTV